MAGADRHQRLADIGAGGHAAAQAVARILLHEAPLGAHQQTPARLGQRQQIESFAVRSRVMQRAAIGSGAQRERS